MQEKTGNQPHGENHLNQVETLYRGYGKYYTEIVRSMSDKIFNWAFTLNTGGLAVTITFMGATINSPTLHSRSPFLLILSIFSIGIISIVTAAFLEHTRFIEKGKYLEKSLDEFNCGNITSTDFIEKVNKKSNCIDNIVPHLEKASYLIFLMGVSA